jgi:hypothetical protein
MVESVRSTAKNYIEIVLYIDKDDPVSVETARTLGIKWVVGPRIMLTNCWNKCIPLATGDIFMQGNDDIIFRTPNWDQMVEKEFTKVPDGILMVYGNDMGMHRETFGPHPFVHRRWVEILGYFIPPYFESDFGDAWVNDLANAVSRRRYIPIEVEHMHFMMGKAEKDQNTLERLERHRIQNPDHIWQCKAFEREAACEKLLVAIREFRR